ncbi:MAG: reactive intermediate/imine deaminase [Smithella sp. SDB]|nr:MAG: reactive intermediate/imine deaminase [Smithella sp. SDB]
MKKNIISSGKFPVFGPYSAAVEVNGFIFISGQIPVDPASGEIIDDIKNATRQILANIQTILKEAGLDMSSIVKTTIYLKSIADFPVVNETYATFFPQDPPARSTVEVSALPKGAPLEIEAIAVKNVLK